MTREQAIEKYRGVYKDSNNSAEKAIDALVALDILKLDSPQTATDKAADMINAMIRTYGGLPAPLTISSSTVCELLDEAGIRVVDK